MKLKSIKTFIVGNPPPHFGGRYWIFIKLITDKDVVGYGEIYSVPFHPNVVSKMIDDVFDRYVKNKDPFKNRKVVANNLFKWIHTKARHFFNGYN